MWIAKVFFFNFLMELAKVAIGRFFSQKAFVRVNHTGFCFGTKVTKFSQRRQCWQSVVKKEKSKGGDIYIYYFPITHFWYCGR
jgi:hypothetical protein